MVRVPDELVERELQFGSLEVSGAIPRQQRDRALPQIAFVAGLGGIRLHERIEKPVLQLTWIQVTREEAIEAVPHDGTVGRGVVHRWSVVANLTTGGFANPATPTEREMVGLGAQQ